MLSSLDGASVYLACGSTDLRKSIDGLAALVTHSFALDLFSNSLFVFCNRERDKLKILFWDHNGFWLYYRRLECGRFPWPASSGDQAVRSIDRRQLQWLLDGLALEQRKAHKPVAARTMV
jgi:transposase